MKSIILIAFIFSSILFSQTKTVDIYSPLQCEMCSENIYNCLSSLKGVKTIKISLKEQLIKVKYNSKKVDVSKIEESISNIGYDANDKKANVAAYSKLPHCCQKTEQ